MPTGPKIVGTRRRTSHYSRLSTTQRHEQQSEPSRIARLSLLGELATTIIHEVTQPLAAISVDAETILILLGHAEPDVLKLKKITERFAGSARRAGDFTQCIRNMANGHRMETANLDLNEVTTAALQLIQHNIERSSVSISTSLDPRLPAVTGDRVQLEQVVTNLLVNAVQASDPDGERSPIVEVRTRFEAGKVSLTIRDNGRGIADGDCQRIFQSRYTTKRGGLGMGLAISRSIVVAHGGEISARNLPEGGAEFEVWVPTAQPARGCDDNSGKPSEAPAYQPTRGIAASSGHPIAPEYATSRQCADI